MKIILLSWMHIFLLTSLSQLAMVSQSLRGIKRAWMRVRVWTFCISFICEMYKLNRNYDSIFRCLKFSIHGKRRQERNHGVTFLIQNAVQDESRSMISFQIIYKFILCFIYKMLYLKKKIIIIWYSINFFIIENQFCLFRIIDFFNKLMQIVIPYKTI